VSRAEEHIAFLKSRYPNVVSGEAELTEACDRFVAAFSTAQTLSAFPASIEDGKRLLTEANTRSRLRMTALYYFAGMNDMLVVGTGNKIEDFGIGFFTKYGDGGVDISPIADLTKTEVYALAASLGVPQSVLTAAPTDGLFGDDRTDEQQIGASYPELEWAMRQSEAGADPASFTARQSEVFDIFTRRHRANRHKMTLPPYPAIPSEMK
jgi:NAD+ synthase